MIGAAALLVGFAFVLSVLLCAVVRKLAPAVGLVDTPGGHRAHLNPTPLGGGVAIWLTVGLVLSTGVLVLKFAGRFLPESISVYAPGALSKVGEMAAIFGLATVVMVMGLIDDRVRLSWKPRLLVQFLLAIAFLATGDRVTMFQHNRGLMSAVTVVWIVG